MLIHAVGVRVINDAPPQPLVRPGAENVVSAVLQEGLEPEQQGPGQQVAEPPEAVPSLHLAPDELLGAAHVEHAVHAQVRHHGLDAVRLGVRVVLSEVEPVVLINEVLQDILDGLVHVPHGTLVAVGDHLHALWCLAVGHASEEHHHVQVVADGAIDGHPQGVYGVLGRKDTRKEVLSDAKLHACVSCPKRMK